jgi:hypothetical protein
MNGKTITIWRTEYTYPGGILFVKEIANLDILVKKYHGEGIEWHRTEAEAIARAEEMRIAKIASLKKQIAKLEKMKFGE